MALGKGALAISPRGYIYDNDNIDRLLFERHLSQKKIEELVGNQKEIIKEIKKMMIDFIII